MKKSDRLALFCLFIVILGLAFLIPLNKVSHPSSTTSLRQSTSLHSLKRRASSKDYYNLKNYYFLTQSQINQARQLKVSGIGDSILVRTDPHFKRLFKHYVADDQVGRQLSAGPAAVQRLKAQNDLAPIVLVNLGTNGPMTVAAIIGLVDEIGSGHQIFWVNNRVPKKAWQDTNNQHLDLVAKQRQNLHVINWLYYSEDNTEWFDPDNLHPNNLGQREFVHVIIDEMLTYVK